MIEYSVGRSQDQEVFSFGEVAQIVIRRRVDGKPRGEQGVAYISPDCVSIGAKLASKLHKVSGDASAFLRVREAIGKIEEIPRERGSRFQEQAQGLPLILDFEVIFKAEITV